MSAVLQDQLQPFWLTVYGTGKSATSFMLAWLLLMMMIVTACIQ